MDAQALRCNEVCVFPAVVHDQYDDLRHPDPIGDGGIEHHFISNQPDQVATGGSGL